MPAARPSRPEDERRRARGAAHRERSDALPGRGDVRHGETGADCRDGEVVARARVGRDAHKASVYVRFGSAATPPSNRSSRGARGTVEGEGRARRGRPADYHDMTMTQPELPFPPLPPAYPAFPGLYPLPPPPPPAPAPGAPFPPSLPTTLAPLPGPPPLPPVPMFIPRLAASVKPLLTGTLVPTTPAPPTAPPAAVEGS